MKNKNPNSKNLNVHPRNKYRGRYDFKKLIATCPELASFVKPNSYADLSIDFANPRAVKMLNKALLKHYYDIKYWDIPPSYLCPPIPGRADYIHYIADLLSELNDGVIPIGIKIKCLDIGVGANCIYPIIGVKEYGWSFIGVDIDPTAIKSAKKIINSNQDLQGKIELRLQPKKQDIFFNVMRESELIDVTICNPPFHSSLVQARAGTLRKITNLSRGKIKETTLNFGGQHNELCCEGGERVFVRKMIRQSKPFAKVCFWFTTLVAKRDNLKSIYTELKKVNAVEVKTIQMNQGNKISRIVAWTFLSPEEQRTWRT